MRAATMAVAWEHLREWVDADRPEPAYETAIDLYEATSSPEAANIAAWACLRRFDYDQLEYWMRTALTSRPDDPLFLNNLAGAYLYRGRHDDAEALYRRAFEANPAYGNAGWSLANALLRRGEYEEGWQAAEARWNIPEVGGNRPLGDAPWYRGEDLTGARILLTPEMGTGDVLQFYRYAQTAKARGAAWVGVFARAGMERLLMGLAGADAIVTGDYRSLAVDYVLPCMSAPAAFGMTSEADIPPAPYLAPNSERAAAWRARFDPATLNVGVNWWGREDMDQRDVGRRSIPLVDLAGAIGLPGVRLYGLHVGAKAAECDGLPVVDLSGELTDWAETAAAVSALDLVVSIDTATVHLAGAIGVPVLMPAPFVACWRWLGADRTDSPWYPSLTILRQTRLFDWGAPLASLRRRVRRLAAAKGE